MSSLVELDLHSNVFLGALAYALLLVNNMDGGLVTLSLARNNLSATLHPAVGQLVDAVIVDISGNKFTGSIPSDMGRPTDESLLEFRSQLADWYRSHGTKFAVGSDALKALYLTGSTLNGPVPLEVCNLVNLNSLLVTIECSEVQCSCGGMCYVLGKRRTTREALTSESFNSILV
jgi:hypothetical protein